MDLLEANVVYCIVWMEQIHVQLLQHTPAMYLDQDHLDLTVEEASLYSLPHSNHIMEESSGLQTLAMGSSTYMFSLRERQ